MIFQGELEQFGHVDMIVHRGSLAALGSYLVEKCRRNLVSWSDAWCRLPEGMESGVKVLKAKFPSSNRFQPCC